MNPIDYQRPSSETRPHRRKDREFSPARLLIGVIVGLALLVGFLVLNAMLGGM